MRQSVSEAGERGISEARPRPSPGSLINLSEQAPIIFEGVKARPEAENCDNEPVS